MGTVVGFNSPRGTGIHHFVTTDVGGLNHRTDAAQNDIIMESYMRGLTRMMRSHFECRTITRRSSYNRRRLELEALEDRSLLSANVAPLVSGQAFVDAAHTGTFQAGDAVLPGVTVTLSGTTYLDTSINATTTTDANGRFQFLLVPNGTYQLSFLTSGFLTGSAGIANVAAPDGVTVISAVTISGGQSLTTGHIAFLGIDPSIISLRMFLASSTSNSLPGTIPGTGSTAASGPFLSQPGGIPSVSLSTGASQNVDLAGFFSAPDLTTSQVAFNITSGGQTFSLQVELFDAQTPQTVANFLDYVRSGAYNNSIFHRLTNLATEGLAVLQGGGATLQSSTSTTLVPITITNPGVANEFASSNVAGTIAMAQTSGNPNSASDQFFFNLADNSASLDSQQFTVFGKVIGATDITTLNTLAQTPVKDESQSPFGMQSPSPLPGVSLNEIPINPSSYATNDSNFPTNTTAANYVLVNSVAITQQNEQLTYAVTGNTNPSVVTASIVNNTTELLSLQAGTATGSTTITVTATDQFGNTQSASFMVTVA
jgi:peptidyl-prolyl cis-trans isomerase A (cyclophilin A)